MNSEIRTPQTHPNDEVVGHLFAGHSYESKRTEIYLCDSYDPRIGYWLTNIHNAADRKNVSERAINRTYMRAEDHSDHYWVRQWNVPIQKSVWKNHTVD